MSSNPHAAADLDRIRRLAQEHRLVAVRLGAVDTEGVWRGKRLPIGAFLDGGWAHGTHLCAGALVVTIADEIVEGLPYNNWDTGFGEVTVVPDLATFALTPWAPGTATVLGDFVEPDGTPTAIAPRHVLCRVVERCAEHGFTARIGYELEFHLFADDPAAAAGRGFAGLTPIAPGVRTYGLARLATLEPVLGAIVADLATAGIEVEAANPEFGVGQFELNLPATDPLTAADTAVRFKHAVREIAAARGLSATFMARYDGESSASSGHIHQSLWRDGVNVFAEDPGVRSAYLAGLLASMAELAVVFCPSPNSWKRIVPDSLVPTTATWGLDNRTVALRVTGAGAAARVEHRLPGADANPYLAIAACLAGGLYGLEHGLEPPPLTAGNAYAVTDESAALPRTLEAALRAAEPGKLLAGLLGAEFAEHFLAMRRAELTASQTVVTEWERTRYFELA